MYKKLRVLQFPIVAAKGGITQYVLNLWKYVNREIIQFDFLTFSSELDFEEELINEGCKVYHISCYPETDIERFAMEYSTVLSHGYDVIELHTSYWKSTIMEEMAKEQGGCKVIIHAHSTGIVGNLSYFEKINAKERHNKIRNMLNETIADKFCQVLGQLKAFLFLEACTQIKKLRARQTAKVCLALSIIHIILLTMIPLAPRGTGNQSSACRKAFFSAGAFFWQAI